MSGSPSPFPRRPETRPPLPDYAHPPLVQVVLAVRFDETASFPPERQQTFEQALGPTWELQDRPRSVTTYRGWRTKIGDQAIVLADNRLSYSWDGQGGDLYPHYPLVREGFVGVWNAWCTAVNPAPKTVGWSVTYFNRIPQGTVWTTLADCSFFRWLCPIPATDGLAAPRGMHHAWQFPLEKFAATLTVQLETPPLADANPPDSLRLLLTCEGSLSDPDDTFLAGFDYGREVIVRTFRQLMTPAANDYWGLKS
uniref:Uncharacterized protein n=1 Tax=Schlesneria paludicola TaxID=360056 RepID=A0A7C2NWG7_9PLAN